MKRILIILIALACVQAQAARTYKDIREIPNFEFWNKTANTLYFSIGDPENNPESLALQPLPSDNFYTAHLTISHPTYLLISDRPSQDAGVTWKYSIAPNKTMYVRMKQEGGKYIFGPQTGPWLGFLKKTERGYSLSNNVSSQDIKAVNAFAAGLNAPTKKIPIKYGIPRT